jgi:drug/metabolite transporter (DMT)-like permease
MQNHLKGIIYASITALFWGVLAIVLKIIDDKVEPITIVWFRFLLAFLILAAWQAAKNPDSFKTLIRPPVLLVIATLALTWNYIGFMMGIHYTTPSNAQLFIQTGPILLAVAGIFFFREKITRLQIIGFLIALAGMAFFYRDQLAAFFDVQQKYNLGVIHLLIAAVAWALYAVLQKKLVLKLDIQSLNLFIFGVPVLILMPFVNFASLQHLDIVTWLLLSFGGVNTLLSYTALSKALQLIEASKVSIIIIMNPIITFVTMGILTQMNVKWITLERFSGLSIIGGILVLSGAVLVAKKQKQH